MKDRILRYFTYFRRATAVYLLLVISFLNFIVIQYRLLIESIPLLSSIFPNMVIFASIVSMCYAVVAVLLGRWDFKKGAVVVDGALYALANPFTNDSVEAIIRNNEGWIALMEGDTEKAILKLSETNKLMEKWRHIG